MAGRDVFFSRNSSTTIIVMKVRSGKVYVERNSDGNFTTKIPNEPKTSHVDILEAVRLFTNRELAANMTMIFSNEGLTLKAAKRILPKFHFDFYDQQPDRDSNAAGAFHNMDVNP